MQSSTETRESTGLAGFLLPDMRATFATH